MASPYNTKLRTCTRHRFKGSVQGANKTEERIPCLHLLHVLVVVICVDTTDRIPSSLVNKIYIHQCEQDTNYIVLVQYNKQL